MKMARINRAQHRSAADIRTDIAKIDRASLSDKVSKIEQERRQLLLSGTDEQLHNNKSELDSALLQVERAETLLDELHRLADEASTREAAEALEAEYAEAVNAKAAIDKAIAEAEAVGEQLRVHIEAAAAATRIVEAWNRKTGPAQSGEVDRRIVAASLGNAKMKLMGMLR